MPSGVYVISDVGELGAAGFGTGNLVHYNGTALVKSTGMTFFASGADGPGLWITQQAADSYVTPRKVTVRDTGTPRWQEFFTENANTGSLTKNVVYSYGFNHVGGGSRVDNTKHGAWFQWEYYYHTSLNPDNPVIEFHYDYIHVDGTIFRPWGIDVNCGTVNPMDTTWHVRGDLIYFKARNDSDIVMQLTIDNDLATNNQVLVQAATYIKKTGNALFVQDAGGARSALLVSASANVAVADSFAVLDGALYMAGSGPSGAKIATNTTTNLILGYNYVNTVTIGAAGMTTHLDMEVTAAAKGVILADRTGGQRYRLYVNSGALAVEAVA